MTLTRFPFELSALAKAGVVALAVSASGMTVAAPVSLDFEAFAHGGAAVNIYTSPFVTEGFRFVGNQVGNDYAVYGTASVDYTGSTALTPFGSEAHTLSAVDGGSFSLLAWDISEELSSDPGFSFTVFGDLLGGGTVSQVVALDGVFGYQNVTFAGFTNLTAVRFTTSPNNFQLDNIELDTAAAVPEPASLALVGMALFWLVATAQRRPSSSITVGRART